MLEIIPELLQAASGGRQIVLALDSDKSGRQAARDLASSLVSRGFVPTRINLVTWPAKDANEYLVKGGDKASLLKLIQSSPVWLEAIIEAAAPSGKHGRMDEKAVADLLSALSKLASFDLAHWRNLTCQKLNLRKTDFDSLLRATRRGSGAPASSGRHYQVHNGCITHRSHDSHGNLILENLCNFNAWIEQDVLRDNGQEVDRVLRISGRMNRQPLPQANVRASEFGRMDWIIREWGSAAIIEPGTKRRDHLRAAIQYLSRGVIYRRIYTHTGWLATGESRVYLSSGGAVGASSFGDGLAHEPDSMDERLTNQGTGQERVGEARRVDGHNGGQDSCSRIDRQNAGRGNGREFTPANGQDGCQDGVHEGGCDGGFNGDLDSGFDGDLDNGFDPGFDAGDHHNGRETLRERDLIHSNTGEPIEVELDRDLALYHLPSQPEEVAKAMALSLSFLDLAPARVTFPLWAAMWLAPLRELVNCAFTLWVYGATGTFKSTLAALALNHYGPNFDDKHLPASFTDTVNRLEQKAFTIKDAPMVIDDFCPQKEQHSHQEYTRTAHRIVRGAGNLSGRGRLNVNSIPLTTYIPRSLLIITGEDLPNSQSLIARLYVVEINQEDVDRQRLSQLQVSRQRLPHAMSGYLSWLAANWNGLAETIPACWRHYREGAIQSGLHLRLPEAVASLSTGLEMGLRFAAYLGQIDGERYQELLNLGRGSFAEGIQAMIARVQEEKPEEMFLRTLRELLAQGKVYLRHREEGPILGEGVERAELLGWYDDQFLYLLPQVTYNRVARHFRDQGDSFPVRESTLRKMLKEAGVLVSSSNRLTCCEWMEGKTQRVVVLRRAQIGI